MTDRVYVNLYVLEEQESEAKALFSFEPSDVSEHHEGLINFGFTDIRGGTLEFLPKLLEHGIAFNSSWEAGNAWGAGTLYGRFNEQGEAVQLEVFNEAVNPPIDKLLEFLDTPNELVAFIREYRASITPLPWDNQVEYGKRHRLSFLIGLSA